MFRRWLDRYDRYHDGLLERGTRRGGKFAFLSFPSRKLPPTDYIGYSSLARHALSLSLSYVLTYVLTYILIVVVGVVVLLLYFFVQPVITHYPYASHQAQEKIVLSLLKFMARKAHSHIANLIWGQVEVETALFAFVFLLDVGTLRAWNRRAGRLRLNPDVPEAQPAATSTVWPPPPTQ